MFRFQYEKTAAEITAKINPKILALQAKATEREKRIVALRKEYDIDDTALIQILDEAIKREKEGKFQGSFNIVSASAANGGCSESTIGAGVVSHLMEERKLIDQKQQVQRLELIVRNLRPLQRSTGAEVHDEDRFVVTYEELEFLGF